MKTIVRSSVMLAVVIAASLLSAAGQSSGEAAKPSSPIAGRLDFGLTYTYKSAKVSTTSNRFGLQGASLDAVYWLNPKVKKLGFAIDLNGESASQIAPGVSLHQISLVAGPRYTLWQSKSKGLRPNLYGEGLVGFVHALHTTLPTVPATDSATAVAFQAGGGLNLPVGRSMGFRLCELDYIATKLPNNNDTYQGDLRVSGGVIFHF